MTSEERELRTPELSQATCTRIRELLVTALRAFCFLWSLLTSSFPLPFGRSSTSRDTVALPRWGGCQGWAMCATQASSPWKSWRKS